MLHNHLCTAMCCSSCALNTINLIVDMSGKRHLSEMDVEELRVRLQDAKRRALLIENELQRRMCDHTFEAHHVSGPRDNNEYEYICSKCGLIY